MKSSFALAGKLCRSASALEGGVSGPVNPVMKKVMVEAKSIVGGRAFGGEVGAANRSMFTAATRGGLLRQRITHIKAIIIGPPGSGKGTISERIVRDFKLDHLSSGDMLRHHIANKTEFGVKIAPIVAAGGLVGIDLLAPLIEHELKNSKSPTGWLLDGYPRTVEQAERLVSLKAYLPNLCIYLNVPFETIIERIKARWVHVPSGRVYNLQFNPPKVPGKDDQTGDDLTQREDDKPESVQKRLQQYQQSTDPVLKFFKKENILKEFAGTESNVIYPKVEKFLKDFTK